MHISSIYYRKWKEEKMNMYCILSTNSMKNKTNECIQVVCIQNQPFICSHKTSVSHCITTNTQVLVLYLFWAESIIPILLLETLKHDIFVFHQPSIFLLNTILQRHPISKTLVGYLSTYEVKCVRFWGCNLSLLRPSPLTYLDKGNTWAPFVFLCLDRQLTLLYHLSDYPTIEEEEISPLGPISPPFFSSASSSFDFHPHTPSSVSLFSPLSCSLL